MELKVVVTKKGAIFEGKAPEIIQKALDSAMSEATAFLEREVRERTPYRRGLLRGSISGETIQKGKPVVKGVVATHLKYGEPVEKGTGIYGPKGKMFTIRPKDAKALFWPDAKHPVKKVVQKGFPGRHMFEKALNEKWSNIQKIFDKAGFDIARKLGK